MKWLRVLGWNTAFLLAGIAIVELWFGGWLSSSRLNRLNLVRNVSEVFKVDNIYGPSGATITYKRDRYGFRGNYAGPGSIHILTMGGSTTDQRYIDEKQTWQANLEKRFASNGKHVTVVNAGVDGHTTYGNLRSFEEWLPGIPGLKPKYILFYVGINDMFSPRGVHWDKFTKEEATLGDRIRDDSALYYLFRTIFGTWQATYAYNLAYTRVDFSKVYWTDAPTRGDHAAFFSGKVAEFGGRERALTEKAAGLGAKTIWVTQPSRYYKRVSGKLIGANGVFPVDGVNLNGVDIYEVTRLMNAETMTSCARSGAICLDLASELDFEDDDFYDYVHNVPSGTAKIGDYLYRKLQGIF
jgi:hypothetical protein